MLLLLLVSLLLLPLVITAAAATATSAATAAPYTHKILPLCSVFVSLLHTLLLQKTVSTLASVN
jgi:hypothetical protein